MKRAIPHLVLAAVIGVIALIFGHIFSVLGRPPTLIDRKTSEADRVLCYRLLEDRSATFRLSGSEEVLKLVSHVVLTDALLPESGWVDYGVAFELRSPGGEVLWETEVFTRSRQSKADYQDGVWMKENAFSLARGVEVTDDRVLLVTLPDDIPVNSELRLSKLGSPQEVAVRVYERKERTPLERRLALQSLYPSERDSLIARTTFEPWVLVPEWEQLERLRYRFERLAAIGDVDVDFLTRPIWYTGFRNSFDRTAAPDAADPLPLSSRQSLALPISEFEELRLQLRSSGPPVPVEVELFASEGVQSHRLQAQGSSEHRLEVPEGAILASLSTRSEAPIDVTAWGKSNDGDVRLAPSWVTTSWLALTPSSDALEIPVVLKGTSEERLIRISARAIGPSSKDLVATEDPGSEALLHVEFLDEAGKTVGEGISFPVEHPPSSHDYFELEGGEVARSSEVASLRFISPPQASTVRVIAKNGPLAARVFVYSRPTDDAPEPSSAPAGKIRRRYARSETSRWFELSLLSASTHQGRGITLRRQKHVEATASKRPAASAYRSLKLPRHAGKRTVLEPVPADDLPRFLAGGWPRSAWASVGRRLPFFSDGKTRTTLRYLISLKDSGKNVGITVDGEEVASTYAVAPGGSIRLGVLPRGRHVVEVSPSPRSFRAMLSQEPTAQHATIWRAREVYPIGPEGLTIPFELEKNDRRISAILFAPQATTPDGSMVELRLDGGNPRRNAGQPITRYTEAQRKVALPDSVAPASLFFPQGTQAGHARIVSAPLGDDIAHGRHVLHIRSTGKDRLWASFFVTADTGLERASIPGSSSK